VQNFWNDPRTLCLLLSVVCWEIEVSATSWSLVQRIPTAVVRRCVCDLENLVNEEALTQWGGGGDASKETRIVRIIKSAPKLERDGPAETTVTF
jgi:hypothetical protein